MLVLLAYAIIPIYLLRVYSVEIRVLMMDRGPVTKHVEYFIK